MAFLTLFNRRGGSFSPDDLTGLAATVLPAESLAAGLLWQDTAKTIAATADGDPVRVAVCPYTAVEFTAPSDAARPLLYEEGGGKWSLFYDDVDDWLQVALAALTDFEWHFAITDQAGDSVCAGNSADAGPQLRIGQGGLNKLTSYDGSNNPASSTLGVAQGQSQVVGWSRTGSTVTFYQNVTSYGTGTMNAPTTFDGIANVIGANFFNGRLLGTVLLTTVPTAAERAALVAYLAALTP